MAALDPCKQAIKPIRAALIGLGKIARDQHLPAIAADADFTLAATVGPIVEGIAGTPHFKTLGALFADGLEIDAAILCTPPQARYDLACQCLEKCLHVLLEKPPGITVGEVQALRDRAALDGTTLLAGWHSRFAAGVEPARLWLAPRAIHRVSVIWREDVRVWHPNQDWIWEPGGLGVFDPGINALSILTHILPRPFHVMRAQLAFPVNRAAPIAAELDFLDSSGTNITMNLDWREAGEQIWRIDVETDAGRLALVDGGANMSCPDGDTTPDAEEYARMYEHFARLIRDGASDADVRPLCLVADAFLSGERLFVKAF